MSCHFPLYISERACPATARSTTERPTGRGQKTRWRKKASFRGTKARRATTRRGSPRNRDVCEWGRGEGGQGAEVPCRPLFQRPSTRTSRTRLEEKGGLGIPRPKPTQASPRSRSLQWWSHSSPWSPRRPSQPRGGHRHRQTKSAPSLLCGAPRSHTGELTHTSQQILPPTRLTQSPGTTRAGAAWSTTSSCGKSMSIAF